MMKVAVTGGIGAGKSVVCKVFEKIGIPVFNADLEARKLMDTDTGIREMLIKLFGLGIFNSDSRLNRSKFANIIFNDKVALQKINGIIHPAVRTAFNDWAEKQDSPYVIEESAIVFESGLSSYFDKVIFVSAPTELRIDRILKREDTDRKKILERMKNQMDEEDKARLSDYIIINDGKQLILPQIINIHKNILL